MGSEVDLQCLPEVAQPVDFQVLHFVHGLVKKESNTDARYHYFTSQSDANAVSTVKNVSILDVCFQKQLDEIALWFEKWSHPQRCSILEYLVLLGDYNQFQLLHTSVQPIFHRDFMYNAQERFPNNSFTPISTEASRAVRQRLIRNRMIQRFHRAKSAYVKDEADVKVHAGLLPNIKVEKPKQKEIFEADVLPSNLRLPALHHRNSLTNPVDHVELNLDEPTANWSTTMHVRRHLQEEGILDYKLCSSPIHAKTLYQWYSEWSGPQRAVFLQLALKKLDSRQLYFLSTYLAVRRHRDMLALLPPNVAHYILSFLLPADLGKCAKVSTTWRKLCSHKSVWKQKFSETQHDIHAIATPPMGRWKSAYRRKTLLKQNWSNAQYTNTRLLGHTDSVLCLVFNNAIVVSGSKDCTVRLWNISSGRLLHMFTGHQKGVWAVAIVSNHLVASGSYDKTVKIWAFGSCTTGCLRTLYGHQGPIWTMVCKNKYLATGSQDRLIKLWDIRHCRLLRTMKGHTSTVFCMDSDSNMDKLYTGSADRSIRVWEVKEGTCVRIIWTGEATAIMSISFSCGLLACTSGGRVSIWNSASGTCVRVFRANKKRIESVYLKMDDSSATSGKVFTGGKDGRIKYWNISGRDSPVHKLDGHDGQINCVCADSHRIVTASYDRSIIIWDFQEQRSVSRASLSTDN